MRSLFVASAGGHLEELRLLADRLGGEQREVTWVSWDTPQSRALFAEERHELIDFVPARDPRATLRTFGDARRILSSDRFEEVVSTGALPAVPFIALARARGIACHYIESATRLEGPSLTGRLVRAIPGVRCYRQYPDWGRSAGWSYCGSVFDAFSPGPRRPRPIRKVVVSLGSSRYGFRRLVEAVLEALPGGCEVLWQTGDTDLSGLGIESVDMLSPGAFHEAVGEADLVVAHGGVGTVLAVLQAGRCPLLVPRVAAGGEHVDDHQVLLVQYLARRGLAVTAEGAPLAPRSLAEAAARSTRCA